MLWDFYVHNLPMFVLSYKLEGLYLERLSSLESCFWLGPEPSQVEQVNDAHL